MTPQELVKVAEMIATGKCQLCDWTDGEKWKDWEPGFAIGLEYTFSDFRIKPEPKLRPWKPEEVPVGAIIKGKMGVGPFVILGYSHKFPGRGMVLIPERNDVTGGWQSFGGVDSFYSTDHGKTWQPCGVYE